MNGCRPAVGVFLILMGSYAYFWHARDWNASSRLMLTYSLVDRGRVTINGLEDHTRDRARIGNRYFTEKNPGYSLLSVPSYALSRTLGLPPHPLGRKGDEFTHWPADYWVTLGTSGLLSALCASILSGLAVRLGCGPRRAALVGLAYGLATPAYVYATLSYGHQATACLLLASFASMEKARRDAPARGRWLPSFVSGACAAGASVVELQVGPVSALLGLAFLGLIATRRLPISHLAAFAAGAAGPTAVLLIYNAVAFGSPFDSGYFHLEMEQFRAVHSEDNPLGLRRIASGRTADLLWGEHRGLLWFAPILLLAPAGWIVLAVRRAWMMLSLSLGVCVVVFLVNLSYPEWTGGWTTGPRLLVPLLPFAMLPVAALLATPRRTLLAVAVALAIAGGVEMLMFQAVGGRIPQAAAGANADTPFHRPFRGVVWPQWKGDPIPMAWTPSRFDRTIVSARWPTAFATLPVGWRWLEFAPLMLGQCLAIGALMLAVRSRPAQDIVSTEAATCPPRVASS